MRILAAVMVVGAAMATAPVGADEYQPGTQPRTVPPDMLGPGDNQLPVTPIAAGTGSIGGVQLERASYCLDCHEGNNDDMPANGWEGSMMANAARDPLMYAALAIANQDLPGVGGDYCLRCHSPVGFTFGHTTMNPPPLLGGRATPVDATNPNRYPCNQYDVGSMNRCKCLAADNCVANPQDRDFCDETPDHVANGYCIIKFGDSAATNPNYQGHPDNPVWYHDEVYEQLYSGQTITDAQTEGPNGAADPADDTEGIQCAFCHRLDPAKNGATRLYGGNYALSAANDWPANSLWLSPRATRMGPFADTYTNCLDGNNAATCDNTVGQGHRHPIQYSQLHTQANLCGICHDVTNPALLRLNPDGSTRINPATGQSYHMPIERTFSEWAASDFRTGGASEKQCQACHMPKATQATPACRALGFVGVNDMGQTVNYDQPYNRPSPGAATDVGYPRHVFAGGNVWMPTVFRDVIQPMAGVMGDPQWFYDLVNATTYGAQGAYQRTADAATAMLQSAATLALTGAAPATTQPGQSISFSLRVTNNSGHKLPTGYPEGRRMWLQVEAGIPSDPNATGPFFASGAWDAATGVLTRDAALKIYEVALGVSGAAAEPYPTQFHFVKNQIVFQDNRIPPLGFDPTAASFDELAPVPASLYPATTGGKLPNWDDTSYTIPVPATASGDVVVTVSLLYQTASNDYVDFLQANNTTNPRGNEMKLIWSNHDRSPPVVMATTTFTVTNTAPYVGPPDLATDATADLSAVAPDDLAAPSTGGGDDLAGGAGGGVMTGQKHGCGVSIAGADWSDLGPLALLVIGGALVSRRRRARR
jgi:MYXO-CTERM domain-containing protein